MTVRRKQVRHINYPGQGHELTFSCYQGLPLLSADRTRQWLVDAVDRCRRRLQYAILAYVIMPEHAHLVVLPQSPRYDIAWFLKGVKQSVSRKARAWLLQHDQLWLQRLTTVRPNGQTRFCFWLPGPGYDRNVKDRRTLRAMIKYIHANPVRRGLVQTPSEWRWSSALDYETGLCGPLSVERFW